MKNAEEYIKVESTALQRITSRQAWHYKIIPFITADSKTGVFIDETADNKAVRQEIAVLIGTGAEVIPYSSEVINRTLSMYYRRSNTPNGISGIGAAGNEFLERIIFEAEEQGASDIHFERYEESARIRFRLDGYLQERYTVSTTEFPSLINKIKIKANLDIAEKRLPQDGRIAFSGKLSGLDIRVSVLPGVFGEKIVLRLLRRGSTETVTINELGFSDAQIEIYKEALQRDYGIILVSGPTGSGKTTTLYATLRMLNSPDFNIMTIEDPVEYTLEGINQVQAKESIGFNFATALRTFLRQDPDIIMVGEIRDAETAQMAIRAALTGHLVLSTIHTNSAWGTVSRLIDMGVPPFLLADTLILSMAQRLVRRLCNVCKTKVEFDHSMIPPHYKPGNVPQHVYIPSGCPECYFTGYKGRIAIYELLEMDQELAERMKYRQNEVPAYLRSQKMRSLQDQSFEFVKNGITSPSEVYPILLSS
ncbi:MAG: GspE/PulE family protein [Bacteroidales bacterium]|nr:GspE/PulE family protein [Bacteroidales bacterium]MDD3665273.1 GspE/PulE family protein [Bacteroidales bacterium]